MFSCAYCEISKNTFLSKHVFFPVAPSVLMFQNRELPSFIIHYLYALKRLIKAERTSNWSLHIESTNIKQVKCICFVWSYQLCQTRKNVLSAYAKYYWAVSLVVQNVCPTLHGVRRSDSRLVACGATYYWIGSIKTLGGLTRGRVISKCFSYVDP